MIDGCRTLVIDDQEEEVDSTPSLPNGNSTTSRESENTVSICPVYKWGRCPDYANCQYRHPPRCWNWLTHGKCAFRNKCRFHHPPLCYNSVWEKQCFNPDCKFFHLTRTLRNKQEDEQLMNSLSRSNYQNQSQPVAANYQAEYPQLPQAPQQQQNHAPQSQTYHATSHPQQHAVRNAPAPQHQQQQPNHQATQYQQQQSNHQAPQYQQQQSNQAQNIPHHREQQPFNPNYQARSSFSQSDVSFLAKTIKDVIKEELAKDISNLRQELEMKIQCANRQISIPQPQVAPLVFSQMPGIMNQVKSSG